MNRVKISKETYGKTHDGVDLYLYRIRNSNGLEVHISNYGATILSIFTPDKNDNLNDIVLVSLRDFQQGKGDIIHKYNDSESKKLQKMGELDNIISSNKNDDDIDMLDIDDDGIDFEEI